MKISDIVRKISGAQFVINDSFINEKSFAITESTPENYNNKFLCIDFGNKIDRYIGLDFLILVLKEFYGDEYLIKIIKEIKPYNEIKDRIIK